MGKNRSKKFKLVVNVATALVLGAFVYALRSKIGDALQNARANANPYILLLMIPAQGLNYLGQTGVYQGLLGVMNERLKKSFLFRVCLELNFVNTVLPAGGVGGFSYFGIRMHGQGISTGKITLVTVMKFVMLFASFQALLLFGLIGLAIDGKAYGLLLLVAGGLSTLLFVASGGLIFVVGSKTRMHVFFVWLTRAINKVIHVLRRGTPETINIARVQIIFNDLHESYQVLKGQVGQLKKPLLYAVLANFAEVLTIYVVYLAFGHRGVNIGAIIIAYAIANVAGLISVLPGGVGVYEALMTAVLATAGVSPAISIPVTLTYRVLNMLLQLPVGYYLYHQTVSSNDDA